MARAELKTKFSIKRVIFHALWALPLYAIAIVYVVHPNPSFDWAVAGVIATAVAAAFTAWAAWAATRAAEAAIEIDNRRYREERWQRDQRAMAMAGAIARELRKMSGFCRMISHMPQGDDAKRLVALRSGLDLLAAPMTEHFVDRFSDFDLEVSAPLTQVIAVLMQLRYASRSLNNVHVSTIGPVIAAIIDALRVVRFSCVKARLSLRRYVRQIADFQESQITTRKRDRTERAS